MAKTFYKRCEKLFKRLEKAGNASKAGDTFDYASKRDIMSVRLQGDRGAQLHNVPGLAFKPDEYVVFFSLSARVRVTNAGVEPIMETRKLTDKELEEKLDALLKVNNA